MSGSERTHEQVAAHARQRGPLAPGSFRTVVYEADGRLSFTDHPLLGAACGHADDAASERWDGIVSAYVVDHQFSVVHTGKHYGEGG